MSQLSEKEKALRGELYYAFSPQLQAERQRCFHACERYNNAGEISRRELITLWRDIIPNAPPLPPVKADEKEEEEQLLVFPWIERPFRVDYGRNVDFGKDVYINFNCTILDTCKVTIGDRCLFGPNVSLYAATHPLDPAVRNGTRGPELGAEIHIEADCWIGGSVIVLPNVTIGRGAAIGAGSVVTKVRNASSSVAINFFVSYTRCA